MEALVAHSTGLKPLQISTKPIVAKKTYSSGFKNLLSVRKFSGLLEKHYAQLMQIEKDQNELNKNILGLVEAHAPTETVELWQLGVKEINIAVSSVNQILNTAKAKVANKVRSDSSEMWQQFDSQLIRLKEATKNLAHLNAESLLETEQLTWKNGIATLEDTFLPLVGTYAEACRVELQMIERYTPAELDKINLIILNHIPKDYTAEEVDQYEKEYLVAVQDFEQEFHEDKNLWDTILDILAGGTHQSPAEHVMMERWLEGDKHDL